MTALLDPREVQARLEQLRVLWRPLTEAEARARMEDPAGLDRHQSFEAAVAQRLEELRALCELSAALRRQETGSTSTDAVSGSPISSGT